MCCSGFNISQTNENIHRIVPSSELLNSQILNYLTYIKIEKVNKFRQFELRKLFAPYFVYIRTYINMYSGVPINWGGGVGGADPELDFEGLDCITHVKSFLTL